MPIPFQQDKLIYNAYSNLPMGVGFTRVFNNTASTLQKFRALNLDTDGVRYADSSTNLQCHGFAWEDIDPNTWGWMAHDTELYQQDWFLDTQPSNQYLVQGTTYFLGTQGRITNVAPTTGIIQELGVAASITSFIIEIQGVSATGGALGAILTQLAQLQTDVDALELNAMLKPVYDTDNDGSVDTLDEVEFNAVATAVGQTAFVLPSSPLQPNLTRMYVNGSVQQYGIDYTVTGAALNWISTDFQLSPQDEIIIYYR